MILHNICVILFATHDMSNIVNIHNIVSDFEVYIILHNIVCNKYCQY